MPKLVFDRDVSHISVSYSITTSGNKTRYGFKRLLEEFGFVKSSHVNYAELTEYQISEFKEKVAKLINEHAEKVTSLDLFRDGRSIMAYPGDFETPPSQGSVG